jgi:hypothetical protein
MHTRGQVVSQPCGVHKVQGSNPEVMHIFSKCFIRACTRIYRLIPAYTVIYFHISSIYLYIPLNLRMYIYVLSISWSSRYIMVYHRHFIGADDISWYIMGVPGACCGFHALIVGSIRLLPHAGRT